MFLQKGKTIEDQKINVAKTLNGSSIPQCFQVRQIIKQCLYLKNYHHCVMNGS